MNDIKLIEYLQKISKKVSLLKARNRDINKNPDDLLFAFRGESCDYGRTKLMPSIFRNSDYVKKEKYLFELLGDYDVINDSKNRNIERAIEAQHYVSISRMLDITFNVLPAIYFCCQNKKNIESDGKVFIFAFPEHYSPHSKYIEDFYSHILDGIDIAYSKNFKVVSQSFYNDRLKSQNGGFIFFQGKEFSPINDIYYEEVTIKANDKIEILNELHNMFAVDESSLFPEKEKRAKLVKRKFNNGKYLCKKLTIEAEIDTYFERIKYECAMEKNMNSEKGEPINFARKIRKEKSDLISYLREVYDESSFNTDGENIDIIEIIDEINKEFKRVELI